MSFFKKIMIAVGVVIVIAIVAVGVAIYATSGMTDTIRNQLDALKSGDVPKAYSYTSKDFQNATSLSDFEKFIERYPSLRNNESTTFTTREISNGVGTVKGMLHAKDGAATPIEYRLVKENGEWKILEITVNPIGPSAAPEETSPTTSTERPFTPADLTQLFDEKDSRYTIKYPENWEYDKSSKGTVIFSGKKGTQAYYSTVNVQTVLTKKTGGEYGSVGQFIADIKKQATSESANAKFLEHGPFTMTAKDGSKLDGEYLIFTYTYKGIDFKQWQIVVLRPDGQVFYAWAYTSPVQQYDMNLPIAKEMLKTWTVY